MVSSEEREGEFKWVLYLAEGVMVAHDAANVSEHFKKATADHGDSEADESF